MFRPEDKPEQNDAKPLRHKASMFRPYIPKDDELEKEEIKEKQDKKGKVKKILSKVFGF